MAEEHTQLQRAALFAKNFVRHPRMLGSVIPSSRFLTRRLLSEVDFARDRVLVEYGPGVGTMTQEILRRIRKDAVLLALETNPEFAAYLRRTIPDPRLHVFEESAVNAGWALRSLGLTAADHIISGIPFSTIPVAEGDRILDATRAVLHPDGGFGLFQFSPQLLGRLRTRFSRIRRGFEPLNVPPAYLFFCRH